jgi:hypothetical protein
MDKGAAGTVVYALISTIELLPLAISDIAPGAKFTLESKV